MVRLARKSLWISGQGAGDMGRAEDHRIPEEIALTPPQPDAAKAELYIERALAVARRQQAKSWEAAPSKERDVALARPSKATASSRSARFGYGCFTEDSGRAI